MLENKYNKIVELMDEEIAIISQQIVDINVRISNLQEFIEHLIKHDSNYHFDLSMFSEVFANDRIYQKFCDSIHLLDYVDYEKNNK